VSDEPLYCPFCGAEDFGCECPHPEGIEDPREVKFCEVCGAKVEECGCGF
jgi:hypothetical protein